MNDRDDYYDSTATVELRRRIHDHLRCDEDQLLDELIVKARFTPAERERINQRAAPLIEKVRAERTQSGGIDAFMNTYDLSSREGIVLMCLAEALLRGQSRQCGTEFRRGAQAPREALNKKQKMAAMRSS